MGNRLSKIYTRTGDDGTTGLGDGSRIEKDDIRMQTIGTVDELNCTLGVLITQLDDEDLLQPLMLKIQHHLFDLGGELCIPEYQLIQQTQVDWLEQEMDAINDDLPALKNFILPGGNPAAAHCHLARAVCRRAERHIVTLGKITSVHPEAGKYLNRLSDLLFVCARSLARRHGGEEILWQQATSKAE